MTVEALDDARAFLARAARLLVADEARHNLALGLAGTIRDSPDLYAERRFWCVLDGDDVVGAALRTPPHNLVLARPANDAVLDELVAAIEGELPGVVGATPEVHAFAARWSRRRSCDVRVELEQGVYALDAVQPVQRPPGTAREATAADRSLVVAWWNDFAREALPTHQYDEERSERTIDHRLRAPEAGVWLWEDDGEIVSLAGYGGATPTGIRIGPVYTPPRLRGRGYATALVADLSQHLLDRGRRFCFLYTDLANPTSNAIYERIGYRRVCDSVEVEFIAREPA